MAKLVKHSPEAAMKAMASLRHRNVCAKKNADEAKERLKSMGMAGASALGLGYLMGTVRARHQTKINDLMVEGKTECEAQRDAGAEPSFFGVMLAVSAVSIFGPRYAKIQGGQVELIHGASLGVIGAYFGRSAFDAAIAKNSGPSGQR